MPHRVSVLCPQLALEPRDLRLGLAAALLQHTLIYELLLDHGVVAIAEPDLALYKDSKGKLLDGKHPERSAHEVSLFESHRLHELLTFTLDLRPALGGSRGQLHGVRFDGQRPVSLDAPAGVPLSVVIEGCVAQWLRARGFAVGQHSLPTFDVREFLAGARHLRTRLNAHDGTPEAAFEAISMPLPKGAEALSASVRRALMMGWHQAHPEFILNVAPEDLWARREAAMLELSAGIRKQESLVEFARLAPQWGRARMALFGAPLTKGAQLQHAAMAATLMPGDPTALANYAVCLLNVRRADEAYRIATRAASWHPLNLRAHLTVLNAVRIIGRPEQAFAEARERQARLEGAVESGALPARSAELALTRLVASNISLDVGRRAEAIAIRRATLELTSAIPRWDREAAVLERWQAEPDVIARSFGRAGYHRGRPDAVIEGFRCATPERGTDLAKLLQALLDTGQDGLAAFVYAQHRHQRLGRHAEARLAGARSLLLNGYLEAALEQLQIVQLRLPQAGHHVAVNTLLRFGAALPPGEWVASVARRLKKGARRLAWMAARDAADFVPELAEDRIILDTLGLSSSSRATPYDTAWLEPLRHALNLDERTVTGMEAASAIDELDRLFDSVATWPGQPLALQDALVERWLDVAGSVSEARVPVWIWATASSLCRYLALCAGPPSPVLGAFRHIADAGMTALSQLRECVPKAVLGPLLHGLAAASVQSRADSWMWDTWLLRVEQALDIAGKIGHPAGIAQGRAGLAATLRGDIEVAFELRLADSYAQDPTLRDAASELYMRCLRAVGGSVSPKLAAVVDPSKPSARDLDMLWTAAAAAPGRPGPSLALAEALLATGRHELGITWLTEAARRLEPAERASTLARFRAAFVAASRVPFEPSAAAEAGHHAFEAGRFRDAVPALAWAAANQPQDAHAQASLGEAYARLGEPVDAMDAFCRADPRHGPHWAAEALMESGRDEEARTAFKVAALGYSSGAEWLVGARALHELGAYRASIAAYEATENLGAVLEISDLWQLAMAWGYLGDMDESEIVARQLIAMAAGDKAAGVAGWTLLAQVELTRGSEGAAQRALDKVLELDPESELQLDSLVPIERVAGDDEPDVDWFEWIGRGDAGRVPTERVELGDWRATRAQMVAARYERQGVLFPKDPLNIEEREWVQVILGETQGSADLQASLCRIMALEARQSVTYGLSPPPPTVDVPSIGGFQHQWLAAVSSKS